MSTFGYQEDGKTYYQRPQARYMTKENCGNWIIEVGDYIKANS